MPRGTSMSRIWKYGDDVNTDQMFPDRLGAGAGKVV
jgi:hypothetical protein